MSSPAHSSVIVPPLPLVETKSTVLRVAACALLITWIGDFLFWRATPGISVAIFVAAVATILLAACGCRWSGRLAATYVVLLAASTQSAKEICFTNVSVLVVTMLAMIGELHFHNLPRAWPRLFEAALAFLQSPARWLWFYRAANSNRLTNSLPSAGVISRLVRVVFPALILAALFGAVLSAGNPVLDEFESRGLRAFTRWIFHFDFSIPRLFMWLSLATFALAALRPHQAPAQMRTAVRPAGIWQRSDVAMAFWQSAASLLVLNALFFAVNTIDVVYLWSRASLPAGVDPKAYLHEGVHSLSAAVVLSAILLSLIFQQGPEITRSRFLKNLAHLWIIQNGVLIAGVFLRLKLYVDSSLLTEKRIYVGCFLLLVTTGFIFLAIHVERGGTLGKLLWRNAVATFVLFYVIQFVDVVAIASRFNLGRWEKGWTFDVAYHATLGPSAWPALLAVASNRERVEEAKLARRCLEPIAERERRRIEQANWRSWQAWRDRRARQLVNQVERPAR